MNRTGDPELDKALDRLEQDTPDRVARAIRWLEEKWRSLRHRFRGTGA